MSSDNKKYEQRLGQLAYFHHMEKFQSELALLQQDLADWAQDAIEAPED